MIPEVNESHGMDEHLRSLQADIKMASKAGDLVLATRLTMRYADVVLSQRTSTQSECDVEGNES